MDHWGYSTDPSTRQVISTATGRSGMVVGFIGTVLVIIIVVVVLALIGAVTVLKKVL